MIRKLLRMLFQKRQAWAVCGSKLKIEVCLLGMLALGFPLTTLATTPPADSKPEEVILQLKWFHQFNFAGYYAALEQGYYEDLGLKVVIKEGQPGTDFIDEVISGRAHYGIEMPELLIARAAGNPVVVLAAIFQHSPQIFLSRVDSKIQSPHNLIGKKVMWRFDSAAELRAMLANENVSLDQIEFMELSWDINDLIEGRVDAIHAYITDQPLLLEKAGVDASILQPINYGIDFYGDCLFTSEEELSKHPDRVKAFRAASLRGWAYALEHPDEMMLLIKERYAPEISMESMQHEYSHMQQLMLPKLVEIGHMNPGRWKAIGDIFVDLGMLDPDYRLDGFLYDPDPGFEGQRVKRIITMLLIVLAVISLSFIGLIIFNRRLNHKVLERTKHLSNEIVERKQAEEALRLSQQFNESLLNTSPDIIYIYDILDQRNVYSNEGVSQILGYSKDEIITMGDSLVKSLMHPDDFAVYVTEIFPKYQTLEDHKILEHSYRMKHKQGQWRWLHAKELVYSRQADGTVRQIFGINSDVTEQRLAEQEKLEFEKQILQTQKLESLGVLAGGIAHDFNNILMGILGYSELALSSLNPQSQEHDYVQGIKDSSRKAADLVRQMLAYSGKGKFSSEVIDLNHLVNETIPMLTVSISKKVMLNFNYSSEQIFMEGDPSQIRQIIMNLVINASDAIGDDNGVITVSTGSMYCDRAYIESTGFETMVLRQENLPEGYYLFLEVSDSGCGISQEVITKIFEPFYTTKFTGRGLGLSAVLGIVNGHHGMLKLYSEAGRGTNFKVLFPVLDGEDHQVTPQQDTEKEDSPWKGTGTILIADDEVAVRSVGKHMIQKLGFEVLTAADGLEAIDVFKRHCESISLVLLDLTMPKLDGAEVFTEMRTINPQVKVILSSGYNEQEATQQFIGQGLAGFIQKPYVMSELKEKIRKLLT